MKRNLRKEKPKKPKFKEHQDKPSTTIASVFDDLLPAIVDGQLVSTEQSTKLVLKRADGVDDMFNFAYVIKAYPNGDVTLCDETLQQRFLFNLKTDIKMNEHLKIYDKNAKKKTAPSPELLAHLEEGIEDARQGRTVDYESTPSGLVEGLESAARGEIKPFGDFSQFLDDDDREQTVKNN